MHVTIRIAADEQGRTLNLNLRAAQPPANPSLGKIERMAIMLLTILNTVATTQGCQRTLLGLRKSSLWL